MASYSAYKWIPWQLFCSRTQLVGGFYCFSSSPASGSVTSSGSPITTLVGVDGLRWSAANQKAAYYIPMLPYLDISRDINISLELFIGTAASGDTASHNLKYSVVRKGPGGTDLMAPTLTSITVPTITIAGSSGWSSRMYSLSDEMVIPAYTMPSSFNGIYLEVSSSASPGNLITGQKVYFMGLGITYVSQAVVN